VRLGKWGKMTWTVWLHPAPLLLTYSEVNSSIVSAKTLEAGNAKRFMHVRNKVGIV